MLPSRAATARSTSPQRRVGRLLLAGLLCCGWLAAVADGVGLQCAVSFGCTVGANIYNINAGFYGVRGGTLTYDTVTGALSVSGSPAITGFNPPVYTASSNTVATTVPVATRISYLDPASGNTATVKYFASGNYFSCSVSGSSNPVEGSPLESLSGCQCVSGCGLSSSSSSAAPSAASSSVPALPSSSTGNGAAYSDPYFHGFWNQPYYVHGVALSVYSLLSDRDVQLNARFVFLSHVTCPELNGEPARVHCSSHPGTYFGELGLTTASGDRLYIASGNASVGFHTVQVNGHELAVGQSYGAPPPPPPPPLPASAHHSHSSVASDTASAAAPASDSDSDSDSDHPARSTLSVQRTSARSLLVHAGLYELLIENSDRYVDLVQVAVTDWTDLLHSVQPSGLMGSSWNNTQRMPPEEEQHRERDGQLMGCNTELNKFTQPASANANANADANATHTQR